MTEISVAKMSHEDIEGTVALFLELVMQVKSETRDVYFDFDSISVNEIKTAFSMSLEDENKIILVAKRDGTLAGFIWGEITDCFFPLSPVKMIGYIFGAYVTCSNRGKGILSALEAKLIDFFKQKGVAYCELHCMTENKTARDAWRALGYKTFREQMRKKII